MGNKEEVIKYLVQNESTNEGRVAECVGIPLSEAQDIVQSL